MGLLNPLCGSTELRRDMDGDALVVVNNDYNRHSAMPQVPFCVAKPPVLQPKAACFASCNRLFGNPTSLLLVTI